MILITPRTTEKAYGLSASTNTYVFNVPMSANKQAVAEAVAAQFNVKVTDVKTVVQKGKSVRFSRGKNRYPGSTTRQDAKKAYVTLAEGDNIQVFEAETQQETK
jgi:large subunit ribosomal protein L23